MIQNVNTGYFELEGSHYEIGVQTGKLLEKNTLHMAPPPAFCEKEIRYALELYDRYCPGITEELKGFSDETGIPVPEIAYTWMTSLVPRCCSMVLLPQKTSSGHILLARNYEFSIEEEDFHIYRIAATGKYSHIGGSLLEFGRTEGLNDQGLAVSMSSCGLPVSNIPMMSPPVIRGLHFYAVLRSLLENCKNVEEALEKLKDMPIAYNMNLILADKEQNIALAETLSGEMVLQKGSLSEGSPYLFVTNHIAIDSFKSRENTAMENSLVRYQTIGNFLKDNEKVTETQLQDFLLAKYPKGMTAWYYRDYFGTIKSVIMDINEGRFSICWGGRRENGWEDYFIQKKTGNREKIITVHHEKGKKEFFERRPIR